ncbi:MAG: hypothetical protein EHM65_08880 [Acidobacteriales bacterium]|nr:MAG: hypothetical protein EHM65_08880 [Terriglobales bacterium]
MKGDGTPYRSYLYGADLAIWLWTILMKGAPCRPYNVGSDQELTIGQVAQCVSGALAGGAPIEIAERAVRNKARHRYVPATSRARDELKLRQQTDLDKAVARTLEWHKR